MSDWISLPWEQRAPDTCSDARILSSITMPEAAKLRELASDAVVLEIGAAYGYSTVVMALVAKRVVSVDPHTGHDSLHALEANLEAFGVANKVVVAPFRSDEYLPSLLPGSFDLAFVDGDHTEAGVGYDIRWCLRLVKPGGVIAFHDYHEQSCPGVTAALDAFLPSPGQSGWFDIIERIDTLLIVRTR